MSMRLSPRLQAIADFIPFGARLADVGTDHGYLPVWSVQNRQSPYVAATDVHEKPLRRALRYARENGLEDVIDFRLCDGLEGIDPDFCDTIVIAGMGGENILRILQNSPWTRDGYRLLILQPMTRDEVLSRWLSDNGCAVADGKLAREGGRIRQIIAASGGTWQRLTPGQLYVGPWLIRNKDPLLGEYLAGQIAKLGRIKAALSQSAKEEDKTRLGEIDAALNELERINI